MVWTGKGVSGMEKKKVLFVGESWFFTTIETKGFDQFTIGGYQTEIGRIKKYMRDIADIIHMPAHLVLEEFPDTVEALNKYDLVIVSDVGANTFLLHPDTFAKSIPTPNRLKVIADYVKEGGAFGMMGGYMTFMGIEGKGQYHDTIIEEVLPVVMEAGDDREEHPEGIKIQAVNPAHPLLKGCKKEWEVLLGFNRLKAKERTEVLLEFEGKPILTVGQYGKGRVFAWASDCAPHWMPPNFCESQNNKVLWENIIQYVTEKRK